MARKKTTSRTRNLATTELAKVIQKWREKRRQAGQEISGELERPHQLPLNLNTATDKEIEEWLSQK